MAKTILLFAFILIFSESVTAQFYSTQYRVPGQNWMEIQTREFRLIYPERYSAEAYRSLAILEAEYEDIQKLVGGSLHKFPVIINPENDISNGFVSPLNFRSEIELSPIIGKTMNPRSGDWLEMVLPHELVHALHFSVNSPSATRLLSLFSPDVRRSIHSAAPLGVFEGVAVQHESHSEIIGAGRGHHPYFRNQFNSMLGTSQEWSMGQLLQVTDFTPPFGRHYIGGYEFINWLLNRYGTETVKNAISFHYKYVFLGFGTALKHATGQWPGALYNEFSEDKKREEKNRLLAISHIEPKTKEISFDGTCRRMNRPKWVDDSTLVFFARFCNRTSGFYTHSIETGMSSLLHEVSITPDHIYSLSEDKQHIIYSRYYADAKYNNLARGDLVQLDMSTKKASQITKNQRLFSPEKIDGQVFAVQTVAHEMQLVEIDSETGTIVQEYSRPENSTVVQLSINPANSQQTVVTGRKNGVQALWFENLRAQTGMMAGEPDLVFKNGSVYDVNWHPQGNKFLFVSDVSGVMNVYEFLFDEKEVRQITDSEYNAFEPSYSPDGTKIAYVTQVKNEQLVHVKETNHTLNRIIPKLEWTMNTRIANRLTRPLMNRPVTSDPVNYVPSQFRSGLGWLKPRFWSPFYEQENGRDRFSLNLESVNVMSTQAYSAELSHYTDRFWYNITYVNKTFFPGFRTEFYNTPVFTNFRTVDDNGNEDSIELLQQSRGLSVKIPIRYRLKSNVRFSSVLVEPQYFLSQARFFKANNRSQDVSDFGTRHTIGLRTVLNLNVRQFTRDVQPNSGWVVYGETRLGLNSDQIDIDTGPSTITANLRQRKGVSAGIIRYVSPFARWNQSLRISANVISQTDVPVFNIRSQFSGLFTDIPIELAHTVGVLNNRYTIPLTYPDNGGLLIPAYLSNIYLVLFSQTAFNLDQKDMIHYSRTVYGAGLRTRFRISNLGFDLGISIGWQPVRKEVSWFFGSF